MTALTYVNAKDPNSPLDIRPVTGTIGAEIRGVQLSGDLDAGTVREIEAALVRHKVIFFRGQDHLDNAEHEAFAGLFGDFDRARGGEARATEVWLDAVTVLADGLLTGIALYDPELIVLGGGLAEAGPFLLEPLAKALSERRTFHRVPQLSPAELGDEAGCRGAALLAFDLEMVA